MFMYPLFDFMKFVKLHCRPIFVIFLESRRARNGEYSMAASYYFDGDCTKSETILEIQEKFIQTLNSSTFTLACDEKCSVENVQVMKETMKGFHL
jgi:hypothetical protein